MSRYSQVSSTSLISWLHTPMTFVFRWALSWFLSIHTGDGLNGTASGGVADGGVVITACGDSVVWELEIYRFLRGGGTVAYSGPRVCGPLPSRTSS